MLCHATRIRPSHNIPCTFPRGSQGLYHVTITASIVGLKKRHQLIYRDSSKRKPENGLCSFAIFRPSIADWEIPGNSSQRGKITFPVSDSARKAQNNNYHSIHGLNHPDLFVQF